MKRKTDVQIKKEISTLKKFLKEFPVGKLLLCTQFNFRSTSTIERWLERGIPSHLLSRVYDYIDYLDLKHMKSKKKRA